MTTRLIRLALGAITLAQLAEAQTVAKPALATQTQQREVETGSWRAGDAIVWVRVAPTGAIAVYASHGYRSAFAHAVFIAPEDAERWADIADHLVAGQPSATVILADSDLALEPAKQGDSSVLTVRLGGVRPDGITFFMTTSSIREVSPMLRESARTARANQAANAAPPAAAPATPAAAAPAAAMAPAAAAPAARAPAAAAAPATASATPPQTSAAPAAPVVVAVAPSATTIVAPPEVAASGTAQDATINATTAAPVATPAPTTPPAPIVPVNANAATASAASKPTVTPSIKPAPTTPSQLAQVTTTTTVPWTKAKTTTPAVASGEMHRTSPGIIAKPAATRPANDDVSDATKLSASTVANLVKQWESQLDLCYTEYGLKVNPALTGSIGVRLAIRSSGEVAAATFTRDKWSGAGGTDAESCMRARVMAWMFPPASTPSAHEFTVAFAP